MLDDVDLEREEVEALMDAAPAPCSSRRHRAPPVEWGTHHRPARLTAEEALALIERELGRPLG